jgi:hypothetical protein
MELEFFFSFCRVDRRSIVIVGVRISLNPEILMGEEQGKVYDL